MDPMLILRTTRPLVEPPTSFIKTRQKSTTPSPTAETKLPWGRHNRGSWLDALGCLGIMLLCPLLVIYYSITLSGYHGSLTAAFLDMAKDGPVNWFRVHCPRLSTKVTLGYMAWVLFQAALYQFLPVARISLGQLTPAGNILLYRANGIKAWIITHALYLMLAYCGLLDPAIIAKNWENFLIPINVMGCFVSAFSFLKAYLAPSHEGDRKFSGSAIYDFYMGIELNPRFGTLFDFKLFANGRPGIVAWTLIDLSFIAYQYQLHGFITNTILIATYFQTIYVIDFFINEDWYVRTIDIAHDHFGFYLAWGSFVWLPTMYTLQTQYLARNPISMSTPAACVLMSIGTSGYILFRWVNYQKNLTRQTKGECTIWGDKARVLKLKYKTSDGKEHESVMLVCGWWGWARHMNYLGDLVLSYSMCATCGVRYLLPWTYAVFMTVLLIHRCWRDEERCGKKYGKGWEEYCGLVKWRIVPGLW